MNDLHLIYPAGQGISTPNVIGRKLIESLSERFNVINHDWDSATKISPKDGDVLLGHAHPNPFSTFRRSVDDKRWAQRILMQPFTTHRYHSPYLRWVFPKVDKFISICGKYWGEQLNKSNFECLKDTFFQLDLAVDRNDFPHIKYNFNPAKERQFLYIGNLDPQKNIEYLNKIAEAVGVEKFGSVGDFKINNKIKWHGRLDFSTPAARQVIENYDFLIITSYSDANPTVVLEAMAWGLIPICTPGCGYTIEDGVILIPQDDIRGSVKILEDLSRADNAHLASIQLNNFSKLDAEFSWRSFTEKVLWCIEQPVLEKCKMPQISIFDEINSRSFFCRPKNLAGFLKKNMASNP